MTVHQPSSQTGRRGGVVLLAVLVVIVLLSLAAYQYSDLMINEYKAATNAHHAAQARANAESGVHYALGLLASTEEIAIVANGNVLDNPDVFRDVAVGDGKGRFSIIAPADPEEGSADSVRYGFVDESGKININAMMKRDPSGDDLYDMLVKLPNMTEEIADSIVDWLDADGTSRPSGAESDYYGGSTPSYRAKNGPIDSLEELLLVKGVTPEVLYGNDYNRNGIRDEGEPVGDAGFDLGLSAYLTVYSREQNTDSLGQALTYINDSDLAALYEKMAPGIGDDMAKFIVMYRQYGASSGKNQKKGGGDSGGGGKSKGRPKGKKGRTPTTVQGNLADFVPDFEAKKASKKITSFFDLVDAQVSIPGKSNNEPTVIYTSPLKDVGLRREIMPKLFENGSIFQESDIPARVNVNTAPREVVAALPDLTEADVEAILSQRPRPSSIDVTNEIYQTPAWLLTEANLSAATMRRVEKMITTRSQVYRVQVLGYSEGKGPAARVEAVIDMNANRPRIVYWRDLTELGAPRAMAGN
jgi:type II secretory pathway component PulK